jgi:hypothetical protein
MFLRSPGPRRRRPRRGPLRALLVAVVAVAPLHANDVRAEDVVGPSDETRIDETTPETTAAQRVTEDTHHYELEAHSVYTTAPIRGGTNPFGLGFGGRLGFLFSHVYLGAHAVNYLGGTDVDTSETALLLGGEAGYDVATRLGDGWLTLRPQVGVGAVIITRIDPSLLTPRASTTATRSVTIGKPDVVTQATTSSGGSSGGSSSVPSDAIHVSDVYVQPGVTLTYASGAVFAGANGNILIVPGLDYGGYQTTWFAFGLEGRVGLRW